MSQTTTISDHRTFFKTSSGRTLEIREVWDYNIEDEMENIRDILEQYPYVAMVSQSVSQLHARICYVLYNRIQSFLA